MSQQRAVYQWMDTVARQIPQVRKSQAKVWAAFSWGVAVARRCSQRGVAEALPTLGKPDTVERRLQRFVANPRLDWRVGAQGLTAWILRRLHSPGPLVLLVDETSLQAHLKVMVVSLAYRGRALPLAWWCYRQTAWPMGQVALIRTLLHQVAPHVPAGCPVLVQADRGIGCSPDLLAAIEALGWFFLVRVQRTVRLQVAGREVAFGTLVPKPGARWAGAVRAFKKRGWRPCWAVGRWQGRYAQPWLLLTNWSQAQANWYGLRMWEEAALRDLKSGGWQWHRSQIRSPAHANRLWLVLALASAWMSSVGTQVIRHPRLRREVTYGKRWRHSVLQLGLRLFTRWLALDRPLAADFAFIPHLPILPKTVGT